MAEVSKRWTPENWASIIPFGFGHQRPNNYWELLRAMYENSDELFYAWKILNEGVCDGCALGTSGLSDWTLEGTHLCNIRLRLLRFNTAPALDYKKLHDVYTLKKLKSDELRELGRLPYPMRRRKGEKGFQRISWKDAIGSIAKRIKASTPDRMGFYLTSRGMPNECYYSAQKAVRAMGSNSIDNAARICHSPSTAGLKSSVGVAATTCSYSDWIESDLVVFIGSNMANNQPVATKYLHYAKKNGAKVVCINNYEEPGMQNYWIPSIPESALFGTKLTDRFFLINVGGDIAFLNGVLKLVLENNLIDRNFIDNHTTGFDRIQQELDKQSFQELEALSGTTRGEMLAFASMIGDAKRAVFVWSMGITQHANGEDNVRSIINLALTKGFVGRPGCGLMPIRGHSGVQGGAEMGCYSTAFPGGLAINEENAKALEQHWNFPVPHTTGLTAPEMIDAGHRGDLDVLFSVGGNFMEVLPDPDYVEEALTNIPLRVHMDVVLTSQMLLDSGDEVILLPATTRYEVPGGVTQTSTERRIIFSPEIKGRRIGEARSEWKVFQQLARAVKPEYKESLSIPSTEELRKEISRVVPMYDGIQDLKKKGDQFQYGGKHLCWDWKFPTPDGKAHFNPVTPPRVELPEGEFLVATRRGKQFNSIVHEKKDYLNGAYREAILMSHLDAEKLELNDGDNIRLANDQGVYTGKVFRASIMPGNVQVHWPEGNVLLHRTKRSSDVGVPDYNARVKLEKL